MTVNSTESQSKLSIVLPAHGYKTTHNEPQVTSELQAERIKGGTPRGSKKRRQPITPLLIGKSYKLSANWFSELSSRDTYRNVMSVTVSFDNRRSLGGEKEKRNN